MEQQTMQFSLAILENGGRGIGAATVAKLEVDSRERGKRGLAANHEVSLIAPETVFRALQESLAESLPHEAF